MKGLASFIGLVVVEGKAPRPGVPAWLNTDVFRVPDDRTFLERRTYAHYNCTYPNDPTTLKSLDEAAHNRAKAGERDYFNLGNVDHHIYRCDQCQPGGGWSGGQSYAWFCAEEDDSRRINFTRAGGYSSKTGDACWIPGQVLAGSVGGYDQQQQIGLEHGTIVHPRCYNYPKEASDHSIHTGLNCDFDDHGELGPGSKDATCSPKRPADSCVLKKGWEKVCQCDDNCKPKRSSDSDDCCTITKTVETMSVYYRWFECAIGGDYGPLCGSSNKVV